VRPEGLTHQGRENFPANTARTAGDPFRQHGRSGHDSGEETERTGIDITLMQTSNCKMQKGKYSTILQFAFFILHFEMDLRSFSWL
jgi:hypothetical protein